MQKKKPAVRTVQSRGATPKIMRPSFSSLNKKAESPSKKTDKIITKRSSTATSSKTPENPKKKILFPALPPLESVTKESVDDLFIKKCKLCFQLCDFSEGAPEIYISSKKDMLTEILNGLSNETLCISDTKESYSILFALIALHIYRTPSSIPIEWYSLSDFYMLTDEYHPRNFIHLDLIYDIAIALFKRPKFNVNDSLDLAGDLFKLCVYLCRTIDDREQLKLAELIVTIYSVMKPLRKFLLKVLKTAIIRIIYENEPFSALKPILIALASIVGGFKTPLKNRKNIFYDCILPIHSSPYLSYFGKELFIVVNQFLEKDSFLILSLFKYLVQHWPRLQPQKQLILIDEIAWFASYVEVEFLETAIHIIVPQLMTSLKNCHASVSEKILSMWEINDFVWMMVSKPEISYPLIIPILYEVASTYWTFEIRSYATAVLNVMNLNNKNMFTIVGLNLRKIQNEFILKSMERGEKWKYLVNNFEEGKRAKRIKLKMISSLFVGCDAKVIRKDDLKKDTAENNK
ncbi:hypothetical protein TRFO_05274 [Tritrichomonas foetus]|uniref:Phosphoprotein phosphatase n=1 Tax=Tritrichomonas foetus TaxID=1144522 RepID=A0A1J4KBL2_9EUKA|nr:hypothetical protein TRFO_05274 [Tritrichomonas foetus]|eukprot:OHT07078.1 hypothetical protein TRFO_05274 [Tritrichomonas foetus]